NYRMTNIQAAIGVAQLKKIKEILELKAQIQQNYEEGLKDLVNFQKLPDNSSSSYWMCSILFSTIKEKDHIIAKLNDEKVETRPFFTPIDELPFYEKIEDCPISKKISALGINLPSFPALETKDQSRIIELIRNNI
ncbi:MAG: hypothetical protein HKO80_10485, partial [Flavobacteriaceae bacterium]|nr:hypothetical protein [Flavobacteriaceae bacterium]